MAVTTRRSSSGTLVKKLRRSKLSRIRSTPLKDAEPGIASEISDSSRVIRRRVSSLLQSFSLSLSMNTNQLELTRVPGYATPTPFSSAGWVTNTASGGSSGSISTSASGSSSSGAGSRKMLGFCCQYSSVGSVGSTTPTISTSARVGSPSDGANTTRSPTSMSKTRTDCAPMTACMAGVPFCQMISSDAIRPSRKATCSSRRSICWKYPRETRGPPPSGNGASGSGA